MFVGRCSCLGYSGHEDWLDRSRGIEDLLDIQKLSLYKMMSYVYKGHNVWNIIIVVPVSYKPSRYIEL
ncbi:hypothetical protein M6B38_297535 [Iris pallida]|uniref:Uncharacterized protein n=1 Tax=Iris pallida TaxID=29817 RepID=A0AAX6HR88_IRIPA|nr:hypothetical protein M6B38_297535 [Iris pallida]